MEKEKLNEINEKEIKVKDILLFKTSANILSFLDALGIITLEDFLNYQNIFIILANSKLGVRTKEEIRGLIRLARFKYLDEPLITDNYLDNEVTYQMINSPEYYQIKYLNGYNFGGIHLESLGFTKNEKIKIINYINSLKEKGLYQIKNNNILLFGKLIDIFTSLYKDKNAYVLKKSTLLKLETYIDAYKKMHIDEELSKEISFFEFYIKNMITLRNEYDRQIKEATQKLEELKEKAHGGK